MNILCLDYGTRRIGVAVATTPLAEPLTVITNATKNLQDVVTPQALEEVLQLIDKLSIEKVLVGISEGKTAEKTAVFISKLTALTSIPIETIDETLSTHASIETLSFQKKSKREGPRDHIAAAQMLQEYLDLS